MSPWQPGSVEGGRRLGSQPCTPEWLQTGREGFRREKFLKQ